MKILFYYLFLSVCILVVLLEGLDPAWSGHLVTDFYVYQQRSLGNFANNEYPPLALIFFSLFVPFANQPTIDPFKIAMFSTNVILIFAISFFIQKLSRPENNIILGLVLLFSGPIFFYRFELLVIFLVIASLYFFRKGNYILSSILLALATMTKVYPIIYLPYYLLSINKNNGGLMKSLQVFTIYSITVFSVLFSFIAIYNFSPNQIISSLQYHNSKPVGAEGFWSSTITLLNILFNNSLPTLTNKNATWGISTQDLILPLWILDYFWILLLISLYLLYYFKKTSNDRLDNIYLLALTLVPVIFSKLSSPQYLLWYLMLLPIINFKDLKTNVISLIVIIGALVSAFLNQYIYPLNYNFFLTFFNTNSYSYLFYLLVYKYLFLLMVFCLLILLYINHYQNEQNYNANTS